MITRALCKKNSNITVRPAKTLGRNHEILDFCMFSESNLFLKYWIMGTRVP